MSISTKRGDSGLTDLMYGRRVSKTDTRVAAGGSVDELNAAIGVARVFCRHEEVVAVIALVQDDLIVLMGELATAPEDHARYRADGFGFTSAEMVARLTGEVVRLEGSTNLRFKGWAIPGKGATCCSAHLDVARTVCRRAERSVALLREAGGVENPHVGSYLNRLSDLLWLLARWENALRPLTPPDAP